MTFFFGPGSVFAFFFGGAEAVEDSLRFFGSTEADLVGWLARPGPAFFASPDATRLAIFFLDTSSYTAGLLVRVGWRSKVRTRSNESQRWMIVEFWILGQVASEHSRAVVER